MLGDLEADLMGQLYPKEYLIAYNREHKNDSEPVLFDGPDGRSSVNVTKALKGTERFRLLDIHALKNDDLGEAYDPELHDQPIAP